MLLKKVEPKQYIKLRIIATLIDCSIYLFFVVVYIYCVGHENDDGTLEVNGLTALPLFACWFLYFVVLEAVNGATPGHDIVKLKVVRTSGEKIGIYDAFKRRVVDFIDLGLYGIPALICIYKTPKYQRLGDLLADTVVVKKSDIIEAEVTF